MKTIHDMSGGMDSTTLLYQLLDEGREVKCISFNYGQRHKKELDYARGTCETVLGVPFLVCDVSGVKELMKGSSQTDDSVAVPHGHYEEENMKKTVVPNRNMIMLSMAAAYAISSSYDSICYAAHAGDHAVYPDCRVEFVEAMRMAMDLCDWNKVSIYAPYLSKRKEDIAAIGDKLGVPWETTWSCYEGEDLHCGKCGTCQERIEAFKLSNLKDPTEYKP